MLSEKIDSVLHQFEIGEMSVAGSHVQSTYAAARPFPTTAAPVSSRVFLTASLTKPVVACGLLKLANEGWLSINERIGRFLPTFHRSAYRRITLRHLLTHTSGFPEMVLENLELRAAHAGLEDFTKAAAETPLDYRTGTSCRYSSIGFLLLGDIISAVTGQSCQTYLQEALFGPLQLQQTWLGLPADAAEQTFRSVAGCRLPPWQTADTDWNWNSRYWQTLGAPWGGLLSTADDLAVFCRMILNEGTHEGRQILPAAVLRETFRNQIAPMVTSEFTGPTRGWGLGWRQQWPLHHASFGDFITADAMGHWGATGTLMWIDPTLGRFGVLLSNTPFEKSHTAIQRISNLLATA
ncbi:MAG: beta-lactamase family protein [Planctomycetaceae bacterium]|nr:beta-lactamase family protein [Planctomycetaceae bacterium]